MSREMTVEEKLLQQPPEVTPWELPTGVGNLSTNFVRNRDIMLRWLEGQTPEEIAAEKRLTPATISNIIRRPEVIAEIQRLSELSNDRYLQERVDILVIEALDKVRDTMRGVSTSELQFKAAKDLLDRSPILKAKTTGDLGELGAGIGEAIVNGLAKIESERRREIEIEGETVDADEQEKETEPVAEVE